MKVVLNSVDSGVCERTDQRVFEASDKITHSTGRQHFLCTVQSSVCTQAAAVLAVLEFRQASECSTAYTLKAAQISRQGLSANGLSASPLHPIMPNPELRYSMTHANDCPRNICWGIRAGKGAPEMMRKSCICDFPPLCPCTKVHSCASEHTCR